MAMPMMKSQILSVIDFKKTQESRYLKTEAFFFSKKKKEKIMNYTSRAIL